MLMDMPTCAYEDAKARQRKRKPAKTKERSFMISFSTQPDGENKVARKKDKVRNLQGSYFILSNVF